MTSAHCSAIIPLSKGAKQATKCVASTNCHSFPFRWSCFPACRCRCTFSSRGTGKCFWTFVPARILLGRGCFDPRSAEGEVPPAGHVGCVAEVTEVQTFPDGRSNILTVGVIRYRIESYVERGDPYLVAKVSYFEDDEEDEAILAAPSREVAETFTRIAQAVRTINDERATLPDISNTEPQRLSFLVAAAMEIDAEVKQEMLELRSTSERLERLRAMLNIAVKGYEERARIHELAKGNGHGGRKIEIE